MNICDDENNIRKKRTPNFTGREKTALLNLIYNHKAMIENKRTDAVTWREKENARIKITSLFNSQSPEGIPRAKESLKKLYDNLKKNSRKEVAQEKKEIFKTGGGPQETVIKDPSADLILDIINPKTVYGIGNMFDSDSICIATPTDHSFIEATILRDGSTNNNEAEVDESPIITDGKMEVIHATPSSSKSHLNEENVDAPSFSQNNLRKRASEPLQHKWTKRRRPNIQQLNSTQLSEEYLKLAKLKQEFYENETRVSERKNEREEELFQIQKKILLTELETKEVQLKKLKSSI